MEVKGVVKLIAQFQSKSRVLVKSEENMEYWRKSFERRGENPFIRYNSRVNLTPTFSLELLMYQKATSLITDPVDLVIFIHFLFMYDLFRTTKICLG